MPPPCRYRHTAFGLRIASAIALDPYLARDADRPPAEPDLLVGGDSEVEQRTEASTEVEWPGLVRVHVRDGRRMWVEALGQASPAGIAEVIAGPALAMALAQRGHFVLHASAVALEGQVVAVAGRSGAGKSTLGALLVAAGGRPFSDDIVPLRHEHGRVAAVAGPTLAKLDWLPPRAAARARPMGREAVGGKQLYAWQDAAGPGERAPLAAVVLVEDGEDVAVRRLPGQQAVTGLLRVAFCLAVTGARRQAEHLHEASALARRVTVVSLTRPRTLEGAARAADVLVNCLREGWD